MFSLGFVISGKNGLFPGTFLNQIAEFFAADVVQRFSLCGKFFIDFDCRFGHALVGFFRTAHEDEIIPFCDALVTIPVMPPRSAASRK